MVIAASLPEAATERSPIENGDLSTMVPSNTPPQSLVDEAQGDYRLRHASDAELAVPMDIPRPAHRDSRCSIGSLHSHSTGETTPSKRHSLTTASVTTEDLGKKMRDSAMARRTIGQGFEEDSNNSTQKADGLKCFPHQYVVPRTIIRRGLQRLDSVHSPGFPGELRAELVISAIERFDTTFKVHREGKDREAIVAQLERSPHDFARVRWNSEPLLNAFAVHLRKRERVFFTVDFTDGSTIASQIVSTVMVATIIVSVLIWMVGTIPGTNQVPEGCATCEPEPRPWMIILDEVCVCLFTVEYVSRLVTVAGVRSELLQPNFLVEILANAGENDKTTASLAKGSTRIYGFLKSPAAICDLFSVLPYWIEVFFKGDTTNLPWLKLFRLLRVSRVFKLARLLNMDLGQFSDANALFLSVFIQAFPAIGMTITIITIAVVVFSSLIFTVERGEWYPTALMQELEVMSGGKMTTYDTGKFLRTRPDGVLEVSPFSSIPAASWWVLATITTVGYGDIVPVTTLGKMVGALAIIYGTVLLGLPIGIIGSQFSTEFSRMLVVSRRRAEIVRERLMAMRRRNEEAKLNGDVSPRLLGGYQDGEGSKGTWKAAIVSKGRSMRRSMSKSWSESFNSKQREVAQGSSGSSVEDVLDKMPLDGEDREALRRVKSNFEDALRIHGDLMGIGGDQQQQWLEALVQTSLSAGPELDRLSVRVLAVLAEAEETRASASVQIDLIRHSWHELCWMCCRVTDVIGFFERESRSSEDPQCQRIAAAEDDDDDDGIDAELVSPRSSEGVPSSRSDKGSMGGIDHTSWLRTT
eukprot:gnl/TRDRNA2_/TRDRNA2_126122_c0_seq1.p1 gnl/TRDRNA2_/TRDRNA2_126122_c0~~gnl/TRDRNA2_/TRDRNA2_126122_c0_seq1.p1  ORF type:complete len:853 (+),score=122.62 gnl/TRDRNA2_/TRDRNA2_126122_c0_seq1:131-2560(+)